MASTRYLIFLLLLLAKIVYRESIEMDKYTELVKNVQRFYNASTVFFVQSEYYGDMTSTSLMHFWSRAFSSERLLSMAMTMRTLTNGGRDYAHPDMRPLYVVVLSRKESYDEFVNVTRLIRRWIADPIWFVVFIEDRGSRPLVDACRRPTANVFSVNFRTEMLVLCYDEPMLREWYAIDDDVTRLADLAVWRPERGENESLAILHDASLYARRNDLLNMTFRIATVKGSSFVRIENKTVLHGLIGRVVYELSRTLNFSIAILEPCDTYGSWDPDSMSWSGVISQVISQEADLGTAEFTMTNKRLGVVDFTLPLILSRNRLYLRQWRGGAVRWEAYFQAFDYKIWMVIITIIVITPLILTWIKAKTSTTFNVNVYATVIDSYTRVFGIYCQQGLSEFPSQDSLKTAYLSIFLSALIVYSTYSASLISYLTVATPSLPFSAFDDFAEDSSYKLIVFKNSADYDMFQEATNPTLSAMMKLMKKERELPLTLEDGFRQVCSEKVAFYTTEVLTRTMDVRVDCKVISIESGRFDSLAMILDKNSPYTGVINYQLQRFHDTGLLDRIRRSYSQTRDQESSVHPTVDLWSIAPVLAMIVAGFLSALLVLAGERYVDAWCRRGRLDASGRRRKRDATAGSRGASRAVPTIRLSYWP